MTAHDATVPLGEVIREVRGTLTQDDLADAVGTDQGTVSRWERGNLRPTLDDLRAIEDALGLHHGAIVRRAGYVEDLTSVKAALEADPSIPAKSIPYLLATIDAARKS